MPRCLGFEAGDGTKCLHKVLRVWGLGGGLGLRVKPLNMLKKEFVAQRMQ
jgi:hypothetical protein